MEHRNALKLETRVAQEYFFKNTSFILRPKLMVKTTLQSLLG